MKRACDMFRDLGYEKEKHDPKDETVLIKNNFLVEDGEPARIIVSWKYKDIHKEWIGADIPITFDELSACVQLLKEAGVFE